MNSSIKQLRNVLFTFQYSVLISLLLMLTRFLKALSSFFMVLIGKDTAYPKAVRNLENNFRRLTNTKHAVAFNSGTSATNSALYALGANENSRVGSVGLVIPSSYHGAKIFGSTIDFLNVDPKTLCIDTSSSKEILSKIDILIVVHYFGYVCDMKSIREITKEYDIKLIEDCSHAHGAAYEQKSVGSFGDIGIFSLQGAKAVSAGEGGVAVTNSKSLFAKMVEYGHQDKRKYDLGDNPMTSSTFGIGNKHRLHPIGATCANIDLKFLKIKNTLFTNFISNVRIIKNDKNIEMQHPAAESKPAGFCQGIALKLNDGQKALEFISDLKKNRINGFQRNYSKTMEEHSTHFTDNVSFTIDLFEKVVYLDILQFKNPSKLWRFLKVISV